MRLRGSHSMLSRMYSKQPHDPCVSDDLVRLMREIGREDAATALIAGCPMYRIGREDDDFFQLEKSITGNDDEAR